MSSFCIALATDLAHYTIYSTHGAISVTHNVPATEPAPVYQCARPSELSHLLMMLQPLSYHANPYSALPTELAYYAEMLYSLNALAVELYYYLIAF